MTTPTIADFTWDGHAWSATAQMPCWRGFQNRSGPYNGINTTTPSNGTVTIAFVSDDTTPPPPTQTDLQWCLSTLKHGPQMQKSMLEALFNHYLVIRPRYKRFLGQEMGKLMPKISHPNDFHTLIGLNIIHIHAPTQDNTPCIGFEFGCTWDNEHGLGIKMHGTQVVAIGSADAAFI